MSLVRVVVKYKADGWDDLDWTEPCLELGTSFSFAAPGMHADNIPVDKAYVEDEVLYLEGLVNVDL